MNAVQKEVWTKVRKHGRDRFLLKSVGWYACSYAIVVLVIEVVRVLSGRKLSGALWEIIITWAALSLIVGVVLGVREWNQKERDYWESERPSV